MQCPGQDTMFWKPTDVFEIECPKCGYPVEFFKFDVKRKCRCGHPLIILGAAYLHHIGMKEATEKYGNASLEDQEKEGSSIARDILKKLNVQREIVDEICDIIGHHHHPREMETLDFQVLFEAKWLANIEEEGFSQDREKAEEIMGKIFQTVTGKKLAKELHNRSVTLEKDSGFQLQI
jgi:hypothetical protein